MSMTTSFANKSLILNSKDLIGGCDKRKVLCIDLA